MEKIARPVGRLLSVTGAALQNPAPPQITGTAFPKLPASVGKAVQSFGDDIVSMVDAHKPNLVPKSVAGKALSFGVGAAPSIALAGPGTVLKVANGAQNLWSGYTEGHPLSTAAAMALVPGNGVLANTVSSAIEEAAADPRLNPLPPTLANSKSLPLRDAGGPVTAGQPYRVERPGEVRINADGTVSDQPMGVHIPAQDGHVLTPKQRRRVFGNNMLEQTMAPVIAQQEEAAQQAEETAVDQENSQRLAVYEAEGRPTYRDPATKLVTPSDSDETWQAKQAEEFSVEQARLTKAQQRAQQIESNATKERLFRSENRPHFTDARGDLVPEHDDKTWATVKAAKLAEQTAKAQQEIDAKRRAPLKAELDTLQRELTYNPERQLLPSADRKALEKKLKDQKQAARTALQQKLEVQAKEVDTGNGLNPFDNKPTAAAQAAQQRLNRLYDPNQDLADEDLADLESTAPPVYQALSGVRTQLQADDERRTWRQENAKRLYDLKLKHDNPDAWEAQHLTKLGTLPEPEAEQTLKTLTEDFTKDNDELSQQLNELRSIDQRFAASLSDLRGANQRAKETGIPAERLVTLTNGETWDAEILAQAQAADTEHATWRNEAAPREAALLAKGEALRPRAQRLQAAQDGLNARKAKAAQEQLTKLATTHPELAAGHAKLNGEAAVRMTYLQEEYPDGVPPEAIEALNTDLQQRAEALSQEQQARDAQGQQLYRQLKQINPTWDWADGDAVGDMVVKKQAAALGLTLEQAKRVIAQQAAGDWSLGDTKAPTRVTPAGQLLVNPALIADEKQYKAAVEKATATPEAKQAALAALPDRQREYAQAALPVLTTMQDNPLAEQSLQGVLRKGTQPGNLPATLQAIGGLLSGTANTFPSFNQFSEQMAQAMPGYAARSPSDKAADYLKLVQGRGWFSKLQDQISTNLMTGTVALGQQAVGAAGFVSGNQTLSQLGVDMQAFGQMEGQRLQVQGANSDVALRNAGALAGAVPSLLPGIAAGKVAGVAGAALAETQLGAGLIRAGGLLTKAKTQTDSIQAATQMARAMFTQGTAVAGSAVGAGAQTLGSVYSDALNAYQKQGMSPEDAMKAARGPAMMAAFGTAALTFLGGAKGVEALLKQEGAAAAQAAVRTRFGNIMHALVKEGGQESMEEGFDQLWQGLIEQASFNPGKSLNEILSEALQAAAIGGVLGGAVGGVQGASEPTVAPVQNRPETVALAQRAISNLALTDLAQVPAALQVVNAQGLPDIAATQVRAQDAAFALLDLAQGADIATLPSEELAAMGLERKGDKISPVKASGPDGAPAVPMVEIDGSGQAVITQPALDWLAQSLPEVRRAVGLDEQARREQLKASSLSATSPDKTAATSGGSVSPGSSSAAPAGAVAPVPASAQVQPADSNNAPNSRGRSVETAAPAAMGAGNSSQGTAGAPPAAAVSAPDIAPAKKSVADWFARVRGRWVSDLFDGKILSNPAFRAVEAAGFHVQAHGMAKMDPVKALDALLNMFQNGLDPNRGTAGRKGFLDTANLTNPNGQNGGMTAGGTAYRDGPFILVQRKGPESGTGISDMSQVAAVLVNPALEDSIDSIRKALPGVQVFSYNDVHLAIEAANGSAASTTVASQETASTPEAQRATELERHLTTLGLPAATAKKTAAHLVKKLGVVGEHYTEQVVAPGFNAELKALGFSGSTSLRKAEENPLTAPKDLEARLLPAAERSAGKVQAADGQSASPVKAGVPANTTPKVTPLDGQLNVPSSKGNVPGTNQLGTIFSRAARSVVMTRDGPAKAQAGQTLNALGSAIAKHHAAFDDILVGPEAQRRLQGRHAAVQVINGKVTLMLDLEQYVAQHAGIGDPKAAATATAREELWHALSLRLEAEGNPLFSMAQKLKQWRALPAEMKQQVWQSYHALAISTGKLAREMPATFTETEDYSMAEEYLRMLAQNETFQDSITETVDPDSSLLTWIRDVLAALGDKLKQWLKQASPEVRADLQMMVTALQQAEARFAKVSTGKAATVSNPHTPTAEQVLAALSEQQPNAFGDAALNGLFDTLPQAVKTDLVTVAKAKAKAGTKFTKAALARRYLAEIATDETQQTALLVAAMGGPRPATMGMGSLNAMLSRVLAWLGDPVAAQTALSKMDARKVLRMRYRMEEAQAFMAAGVQVSRMTDAQVDNQIVEVNKKVAPVVPDEDEQAWQQAIGEVMPTINAQRLQAQINERTTAMRWAALQQRAARMAEATDALARSDLGNALMKVELAMRERVGRRVALAKALARKRMVDASQKEMAKAVEAGRITPAQALYTARLLDIAGGIADRYARRRVQGIGTHLLATLNAVGIGSEGGNFYTADPNGDAYVERRRVILKQSVLDKLAEVLPASRALIALDEAQARAFYGLPAGPAQPQTRADVDAQLDAERATLAGAEPAPEETAPNAAPVAGRENNPEPWPTREEFFANNPPDAIAPPTVPRDIPRATKAAAATPAPATEDTALEDELGSAADRFLSRKPKRPALDKLLAKIPNASTGDTTRNNLLQTLLRSPLLMPTKAQRKGKGEWDWMETSPLFTESGLFGWRMRLFRTSSSAGRKGDLEERLNALENEGHMPDASGTLTGTDLSDALMAAIGQYEAMLRGDPLTAKAVEDERMTELEAQTVRFEKDTETGPLGVDVASLEPGQVLILKDDAGEPHRLVVESLNITPLQDSEFEEGNPLHFWQNGKPVELTSVALQDGTTYGLQRVAGSATIFVDGIDNGRAARGAAPTNIVPTTLAEDAIPLAAAVRRATAKLAPTQLEALKTYRDLTKRVQSGDRLQPAQAVALEDAERTLGQQFFFDIAEGFGERALEPWMRPQRYEQQALFAANRRVEQGFYSKLAETLDAKMPGRADAKTITGILGEYMVTKTTKQSDGKDKTTVLGRFTLSRKAEAETRANANGGQVSWQSSNGIKEEELKWSGLMTWLDGQKESVTIAGDASSPTRVGKELNRSGLLDHPHAGGEHQKVKQPTISRQDVLEFLRNEGAVKFEEVQLGSLPQNLPSDVDVSPLDSDSWMVSASDTQPDSGTSIFINRKEIKSYDDDGDPFTETKFVVAPESEVFESNYEQFDTFEDAVNSARSLAIGARDKWVDEKARTATQYAQYQLPGAENYREVVLAMPEANRQRYYELAKIGSAQMSDEQFKEYKRLEKSGAPNAGYTSSHFPNVPNYVAHMRVNERTDTDGKRGLFIEENQSDLHQAGREKGYREDKANPFYVYRSTPDGYTAFYYPSKEAAEKDNPGATVGDIRISGEVIPDAPFRKEWPLAMVKRALRDAVATGKDFIGWTVGSVQAERYDISKQVKHVEWEPAPSGVYVSLPIRDTDQQYEFIADTAGVIQRVGLSGRGKEFIGNNLAEVMGKEITAKVLATPEGKLEGDDLRVGGKGMEGFYDNILPKEVQKYVKQWVAKVERQANGLGIHLDAENNNLPYKANATDSPDNMPYWRVDITPAMRESVAQGQALFAAERSFTGGLSAQLAQASNVMGSDTREALPMDEAIVQIESFHGDPEDTDYWPKDMAEQWAADPLRRAVEEEGDFLQALPHLPDSLRNSSIIQQYAAASERYNALDKWVSVELERINALPKADFWALAGPSAQATYNEISSDDLTAFKRAVFINELKERLAKETALSESERYDFEAANELSDEAGEWLESEEMEAVLQGRKNALIDKVKIRVNRAIAQIEATGRYTWDGNTGTFDEQDAPQVLYAAQRALFDDQDSLFMGGRDQLGFTDVQRPQAPKARTPAEMTDDELAATMAEFRRQIAPLEAEQRELREKTKRGKQKFQSTTAEKRTAELAKQIDNLYVSTGAQPAQMEINKRDEAKRKARSEAAANAKNAALATLANSDDMPYYPLVEAGLASFEWWNGVPLRKAPTAWQKRLMDVVDSVVPRDGSIIYNTALDKAVMAQMGNEFRPQDLALGRDKVDGGWVGYEIYNAKQAIEQQRARTERLDQASRLGDASTYQNVPVQGLIMKTLRLMRPPRADGSMAFEAEDRKGMKYQGWVLPSVVAEWQTAKNARATAAAPPEDPNQGTMLFASPRAMEGRDLFNTGLQLGLFNDDTNLFMGGREQLGFDSVMPIPAPAVVVPDEPKAQDLHAMGQQGELRATDPAVPEVSAPSPTAAVVDEPSLDEPPVQGQVTDFGEVIPFARKHTARPLGSKPKMENTLEDTDKDLPAWRRKYIAAQEMRLVRTGMGYGPQNYTSTPTGKWIVARKDGSNVRSPVFDTEQAALEAIPLLEVARNHAVGQARKPAPDGSKTYAIYRKVGERKRPVVKGGFASYEEGMAYMVTHPAEIIEHKFAFPTRPWLDRLERKGGTARVGDVTPQMFQDTFAFRGGQFGNWNMGGDGQAALNGAYDALLDFADILGVQPKALSLNGELAIAFGARGHGGEGAGAAHYEPGFKVINLTKIRGAGSLAHEWFHAFDHYLGRQDGKGARRVARAVEQGRDADYVRDEYVSHGFGYQSGVREALREAFKAVMDRMTSRKEARAVQVGEKQADMSVSNVKRHLEQLRQQFTTYHTYSRKKVPATAEQLAEWDRISEQIMALDVGEALHIPGLNRMSIGRSSFPRIEELNAIYKTVLGRSFATNQDGSLGKSLYWAIKHAGDVRARLAAASEGATEIKTVATDYFTEAKFIDEMRAEDYWSTPHEMGARSFESFIADKLAQHERRNDYLVHGADNRLYALMGLKPYPEGQERAELHQVWQAMFDIIQQETTDTGNVRLFAANRRAEGPTRQVPASQFTTIPEDEARARADAAKGGTDWAANVDLSEPVGAWIDRQDGKLKIFDGHHRWLAAMMTGRPLKVRQNVFDEVAGLGLAEKYLAAAPRGSTKNPGLVAQAGEVSQFQLETQRVTMLQRGRASNQIEGAEKGSLAEPVVAATENIDSPDEFPQLNSSTAEKILDWWSSTNSPAARNRTNEISSLQRQTDSLSAAIAADKVALTRSIPNARTGYYLQWNEPINAVIVANEAGDRTKMNAAEFVANYQKLPELPKGFKLARHERGFRVENDAGERASGTSPQPRTALLNFWARKARVLPNRPPQNDDYAELGLLRWLADPNQQGYVATGLAVENLPGIDFTDGPDVRSGYMADMIKDLQKAVGDKVEIVGFQIGSATQNQIVPVLASMDNGGGTTVGDTGRAGQRLIEERIKRNESALDAAKAQQQALQSAQAVEEQRRENLQQEALPATREFLLQLQRRGGGNDNLSQEQQWFLTGTPELQDVRSKIDLNNKLKRLALEPLVTWGQPATAEKAEDTFSARRAARAALIDQGGASNAYPALLLQEQFQQYLDRALQLLSYSSPNSLNGWGEHLEKRLKLLSLGANEDMYPSEVVEERMERQSDQLARGFLQQEARQQQEALEALNRRWLPKWFPATTSAQPSAPAEWWKDLLDQREEAERKPAQTFIARLWQALAAHDEAFQYGRSFSPRADAIAKAVSLPGKLVTATSTSDTVRFMGPSGHLTINDADTDRPYIRSIAAASQGKKSGGGTQLYQAALDWIHNNAARIKDDSSLTTINAIRRTSNFASSALRWGTTKHLKPHADQKVPWGKNESINTAALLMREMDHAFKAVDQAKEWRYDFANDEFRDAADQPLDMFRIESAVSAGNPSQSGIGVSTLERAVITRSALEAFQRGEAQSVISQIKGRGTPPERLTGILYAAPRTLDTAAHKAATSPLNARPEPTDAQKKAGNYALGHIKIGPLDVSIENPAGSVRRGTDAKGKAWETPMHLHYGYVKGSKSADGDHIDTFIAPGTPTDYDGPVWVVNQQDKGGAFDEHKAVFGPGITGPREALAGYLANYTDGWDGAQSLGRFKSVADFHAWATEATQRRAPARGHLPSPLPVNPALAAAARKYVPEMKAMLAAASRAAESGDLFKLDNGQMQAYFDLPDVRIPSSKQPAARAAISAAAAVTGSSYERRSVVSAARGEPGRQQEVDAAREPALRAWRGLMDRDPAAIRSALDAGKGRISSLLEQFVNRQIPTFDIRGAVLDSPADFAAFNLAVRTPYFESLKIAVVDGANQVVHSQIVHIGALNESIAHPGSIAQVLAHAQLANPDVELAGWIIAHNHPSGDPNPSDADQRVTRRFADMGEILRLPLIDHVITNGERYFSFREGGFLSSKESFNTDKAPQSTGLPALPIPPRPARGIIADWEVLPSGSDQRPVLNNPSVTAPYLTALRTADPDHYHLLYLNTKLALIAVERVDQSTGMNAREFASRAILGAGREGAMAVALSMPGADGPTDSQRRLVRTVNEALQSSMIQFADAMVATTNAHFSFREAGLLREESPALAAAARKYVPEVKTVLAAASRSGQTSPMATNDEAAQTNSASQGGLTEGDEVMDYHRSDKNGSSYLHIKDAKRRWFSVRVADHSQRTSDPYNSLDLFKNSRNATHGITQEFPIEISILVDEPLSERKTKALALAALSQIDDQTRTAADEDGDDFNFDARVKYHEKWLDWANEQVARNPSARGMTGVRDYLRDSPAKLIAARALIQKSQSTPRRERAMLGREPSKTGRSIAPPSPAAVNDNLSSSAPALGAAPRTSTEANPLARLGFNHLDRALTDKIAELTAKPRASAAEAVATWANTPKVKPFADFGRWAQGQLFPDSLLPREITAAMREMQIRSALGGQKAMDLQRALSGTPKFSDLAYPPEFTENPIWRERLFDAMEGRADMAALPPAIQALGKRLRAMLVQHGREAVKAGRMSLETFEGLQENFMPRFTRDEAEAASGDFLKKFKLGVKDILQQRSTAWHIVDTTQKDPRTGEYVTVSHDDRGRKWRFRDEAQRNAFYHDYTKREAVRMLKDQGRQVTDLLAALDGQQKKEVRAEIARMTADQVDRPAELSPALAGIVKRALAIQRQRYERRDPFDPPALIRDPVYAIARYTAQASHDNATAEFFNFVDKHPAWVRDTAATGYVFIPDNPRFGRLAGKHVQADIANQITEMVEAPDTALKIYDTLMGWWKTGKTVLNPGTHVRNVLGNLFFSQLAGNSPWNPGNMGYYKEAIAALRAGGPALIEAYEQGVLGADFVTAELRQTLRQLLPEPASVMSDKPELLLGIGKAAGKLIPKWARTPTRSAYNQIAAAYQVEDEVFKLAAYLKAKGMGMDNKAAAEHVRKWFPYFDKGTSTTLKLVGRTAMPFMGFYRESARIFSHALKERPLALATGLSIPSLITYICALMLGLNDQDKEELMTDMRGKGGKLLGPTPLGKVPLFAMLLPIRTADGDLQQIDLSAIHPFTDFLGTRVESRGGDWWEDTIRSMVTAGPLASLAYAQMTGRDAFGDRTFVEADMTGSEKAAARLDNAGATLLPPLTPIVGTGYKTIANAGQRSTNKTLETRNLPQAITRAIGGVDIRNANQDLYRLVEDWRKANDMDIDPSRDYGTTAISRARAQVFAEIAQDAPDKEKLRRALAFLRVQGVPIDTQQDINRLLFYRDPLKVIGGDKAKGISAKDAQQMFQGSLSPEGRRVLIEAVREFSRIQQRAPAAIASARSGGN